MAPKSIITFGLTALLALTACDAREAPAPSVATISETTPVAIDGFGPIKIGMTRAQIESVLDSALRVGTPAPGSDCHYAQAASGPAGLFLMLTGETLARIEVRDNPAIATTAGIHIASNEPEIEHAYGARVSVAEQKYQDGHDFTVTDPAHPDYRYVFETDGTRVTRFRAGRLPEVGFVEGCG